MKKQLKIQITVTEEELNIIQMVATKLGNKPSTVAKNILMTEIRHITNNFRTKSYPVKVKDLIENCYIYDVQFMKPPCKYIGRDEQGFFGFMDFEGDDVWIDQSSMELYGREPSFFGVTYYTK